MLGARNYQMFPKNHRNSAKCHEAKWTRWRLKRVVLLSTNFSQLG